MRATSAGTRGGGGRSAASRAVRNGLRIAGPTLPWKLSVPVRVAVCPGFSVSDRLGPSIVADPSITVIRVGASVEPTLMP